MSTDQLLGDPPRFREISFEGEAFPTWLEDHAIKKIRQARGNDKRISLNHTAGPAVIWGFMSLVGLTYFMAALPSIGIFIARCSPDQTIKFAMYPELVLWLIFFLPLSVIVLLAQWKVGTFILVPQLQEIELQKRESGGAHWRWVPFRVWYLCMCAFTGFNLLDQMTNALFAAKVYATKDCYGYEPIQGFWMKAIKASLPYFMRKALLLEDLDFATITVAAYIIQLLAQPIYAIVFSCPLSLKVDFRVRENQEDPYEKYKTISDNNLDQHDLTDFSSAIMVLAEVNRFEAITNWDMVYRKAMISRLMATAEAHPEEKFNAVDHAIEIGLACLARSAARFALKGIVQNAIQVNLQVSMTAITKALMEDFDMFNAFNLGVTILALFADIPDMIDALRFTNWLQNKLEKYVDIDTIKKRMETLQWRFFRIKCYAVIYVGLAGYALLKLFMAVLVCEYGEWNMMDVFFRGTTGCVSRPDHDTTFGKVTCRVTEMQCF